MGLTMIGIDDNLYSVSIEKKLRKKETYAAWVKKYPERKIAHNRISMEVRNGRMKKEPCKICGSSKSEAHHEDYSKPLEVVWLCKKHHHEFDLKRQRKEALLEIDKK